MIRFGGGISERGVDVFFLQIRVVFEDFFSWDFRGKEIELVFHPDTHSANAGTTSALVWIDGDSVVHLRRAEHCGDRVKHLKFSRNEGGRRKLQGGNRTDEGWIFGKSSYSSRPVAEVYNSDKFTSVTT